MFFLKKIFQKNLNIDEIEDHLFDNGVEPKFADLIISKIKENKSNEEDIKKVIKDELLTKFKEKNLVVFLLKIKAYILLLEIMAREKQHS